jgi:hypothetical protein
VARVGREPTKSHRPTLHSLIGLLQPGWASVKLAGQEAGGGGGGLGGAGGSRGAGGGEGAFGGGGAGGDPGGGAGLQPTQQLSKAIFSLLMIS